MYECRETIDEFNLTMKETHLIVQSLYDIYEGYLKLIVYKRFSSDNCSLRGVFEHRKKSTKNFDWEHCKKFS